MSGKKSRDKGRRLEQEVVRLCKKHEVPAHRISMLETGHEIKGDVRVASIWDIEVKGGDHVPKFLYDATKDESHWLVCKRDRKQWKVVLDFEWFLEKFL